MVDRATKTPMGNVAALTDDGTLAHLREEYEAQHALFQAQPPLVQRFLEGQASQLAEALLQKQPQVRFMLPDRVVGEIPKSGEGKLISIPASEREQLAGGLFDRLTRTELRTVLRQRLLELEQSSKRSVAVSAALLRHATAMYLVHTLLPAGRTVRYTAEEGEEIPSQPVGGEMEPESAIMARTDAVVEGEEGEAGRGELLVPYVEAARRFYLPQWVAFDDQGKLLVNTETEAEAHLASMQNFIHVLHLAVSIAPYMVADEEYQQKRYGMLGQLVNQGRALARYRAAEIIRSIQKRAAAHELNRGLSLSLPYFDDQDLVIKTHEFEVVPAGRIMFVPAFVVQAAREEQVKVAQDTRLNHSTRRQLLSELKMLEQAFYTKEKLR